MLVNSHPSHIVTTDISVNADGFVYEYDAYSGKTYSVEKEFRLILPAYESRIYIATENTFSSALKKLIYFKQRRVLVLITNAILFFKKHVGMSLGEYSKTFIRK